MKMEYSNTCSSVSHWDTCKIRTKLPPGGTKYVLYNLVKKTNILLSTLITLKETFDK